MNNLQNDMEALREAIKNKKEEDIINLTCSKNVQDRVEIANLLKANYGDDLESELKKALSGSTEDIIVALYKHPIDFDCYLIKKAVKGAGTDEDCLNEVICFRPNEVILAIRQRYPEIYKDDDAVKDVIDDTSGSYQNLLVSLLQGQRDQSENADPEECKNEAKNLFDAEKNKDDSVFNRIFATKSRTALKLIVKEYYKLSGKTILETINKLFSGDFLPCLIATLYGVLCPAEFFAEILNKAISKGSDKLMIRTMVSRCEIDMPQIRQFYAQRFGSKLTDDIEKKFKGSFKDVLIKLASK